MKPGEIRSHAQELLESETWKRWLRPQLARMLDETEQSILQGTGKLRSERARRETLKEILALPERASQMSSSEQPTNSNPDQ